jgi:hypothetical protein
MPLVFELDSARGFCKRKPQDVPFSLSRYANVRLRKMLDHPAAARCSAMPASPRGTSKTTPYKRRRSRRPAVDACLRKPRLAAVGIGPNCTACSTICVRAMPLSSGNSIVCHAPRRTCCTLWSTPRRRSAPAGRGRPPAWAKHIERRGSDGPVSSTRLYSIANDWVHKEHATVPSAFAPPLSLFDWPRCGYRAVARRIG